ncbi:unnamed protein product [Symbiodinium sp. CCMP2592]|nr:unnamed protein product [Symbiodinium sp. CCMP2592]
MAEPGGGLPLTTREHHHMTDLTMDQYEEADVLKDRLLACLRDLQHVLDQGRHAAQDVTNDVKARALQLAREELTGKQLHVSCNSDEDLWTELWKLLFELQRPAEPQATQERKPEAIDLPTLKFTVEVTGGSKGATLESIKTTVSYGLKVVRILHQSRSDKNGKTLHVVDFPGRAEPLNDGDECWVLPLLEDDVDISDRCNCQKKIDGAFEHLYTVDPDNSLASVRIAAFDPRQHRKDEGRCTAFNLAAFSKKYSKDGELFLDKLPLRLEEVPDAFAPAAVCTEEVADALLMHVNGLKEDESTTASTILRKVQELQKQLEEEKKEHKQEQEQLQEQQQQHQQQQHQHQHDQQRISNETFLHPLNELIAKTVVRGIDKELDGVLEELNWKWSESSFSKTPQMDELKQKLRKCLTFTTTREDFLDFQEDSAATASGRELKLQLRYMNMRNKYNISPVGVIHNGSGLTGLWEIPERWTTVVFPRDRIVFLEPPHLLSHAFKQKISSLMHDDLPKVEKRVTVDHELGQPGSPRSLLKRLKTAKDTVLEKCGGLKPAETRRSQKRKQKAGDNQMPMAPEPAEEARDHHGS